MDTPHIAWLLVALVVLVALFRLHLAFWQKRLLVPMSYHDERRILLDDGGIIVLRRLHAEGTPSHPDVPVLLVHGVAANHRNNDVLPDRSFARFLSAQGRDVWLLTLRTGQSRPSLFGPRNHGFAALRDHDLPGAIRAVLEQTGARQLDLVAYSMGGMVLYAALGRTVDPRTIRRVAIYASPGLVPAVRLAALARYIPRSLTPTVPMRVTMRSLAFAVVVLPGFAKRLFYNPRNVPYHVARRTMFNLFDA